MIFLDDHIKIRQATPRELSLLIKALQRYRGPRLRNGLVQKHGLNPYGFDPQQLAIGTAVEMEHTSDPAIALEIAMAHLYEDRAYYAKLERMERVS